MLNHVLVLPPQKPLFSPKILVLEARPSVCVNYCSSHAVLCNYRQDCGLGPILNNEAHSSTGGAINDKEDPLLVIVLFDQRFF